MEILGDIHYITVEKGNEADIHIRVIRKEEKEGKTRKITVVTKKLYITKDGKITLVWGE